MTLHGFSLSDPTLLVNGPQRIKGYIPYAKEKITLSSGTVTIFHNSLILPTFTSIVTFLKNPSPLANYYCR